MKVPTQEDTEMRDIHHALILKVLKEDAKKELERRYISKERRRVLEFLIEKDTYFGGFQYWNPSIEARRILWEKGLVEDEFVEGNFQFKQRCRDALEILKKDAEKQLNSEEYTHLDTQDVNSYLIAQNEFTGDLSPWCPSSNAIEELRENRLIEEKYYVEGYFSPFEKWILRHVEGKIKEANYADLQDLINQSNLPFDVFFPDISGHENIFFQSGMAWIVKYKNCEAFMLNNDERIRYITYLLDKPYEDLSVGELKSLVKGIDIASNTGKESITEIADFEYEDLKKKTNKYYSDWAEAKQDAESGNPSSIAEANESAQIYFDFIKYLKNDLNIWVEHTDRGPFFHGNKKRLPSTIENDRINVKKQIGNAIKEIGKFNGKFALHLNQYISTGTTCTYRPDPDNTPTWHIERKEYS